MKNTTKNVFLEFNGRSTYHIDFNGTTWIALKPICEMLNVDFNRQFQNIKEDSILKDKIGKKFIMASDDRFREMVCLPEFYFYGWILSIQSSSKDLIEYKKLCYELISKAMQSITV